MTIQPVAAALQASRICILLHDFSSGGSERIAIRLGNAWAALGRQVSLLCGSEAGPLRRLAGPAVRVIRTDLEVPRSAGSRRRLALAMAQSIAALRPDVVFVPGNFHIALIAPILRLAQRPAVVVKLSNPLRRDDRSGLRRWIFEARLNRQLRGVDAVVAMSPALAGEAQRVLDRHNIIAIAQPTLADAPVAPRPADAAALQLLAAGRLTPQKNLRLAVRALALLPDRRVTLTIAGDGPERGLIEAAARQLGVADRVRLIGHVADLRPQLETARLLLLTSRFEGYPAVAVEALAAGRPVVATRCSPAIAEILQRSDDGVIVNGDDPQRLADAVTQILLRPPPDPAVLAAGVAHHRIGTIAQQYLALFDRLRSP